MYATFLKNYSNITIIIEYTIVCATHKSTQCFPFFAIFFINSPQIQIFSKRKYFQMTTFQIRIIFCTLFIITGSIYGGAGDNAHFYRATNFWGEPRLDLPWLTTLAASFGAGSTNKARTGCGCMPLLNVYGPQDMRLLGQNVPFKDLNTQEDLALELLGRLPCRDGFAQLSFGGHFSIQEANLFFIQNFYNGVFLWAHIPIRQLQLCNINFKDQSPIDSEFPNINTPQWQMVLNLFDQIMARYNMSLAGFNKKGIGDTTVMLGWANNYEETDECDYVDFDASVGVLFPTGKQKNENRAFDMPLGYNGHFAIPISFNLSFGAYDWLTVGGHADALFFLKSCRSIRMNTTCEQSGFIKLACGRAQINPGNIWNASVYAKADHFAKGLSLLTGYTFSAQQRTTIYPFDTTLFNSTIASSNSMYGCWNMSTVHFIAEYDFTCPENMFGPRIGVFYNWNVAGQRVFATSVGGGYLGLDIAWCF
jgi:hypothetical protein